MINKKQKKNKKNKKDDKEETMNKQNKNCFAQINGSSSSRSSSKYIYKYNSRSYKTNNKITRITTS